MEPPLTATPEELYRSASRAAALGFLVNLLLGIVKLIGGLIGNSFALLSDALNSIGDTLNSGVTLWALWYAQQPADEEHPYGHTRVETIAGAYVSLLILLSAVFLGWEALSRVSDASVPPIWTLWIAAANVVIKESLFWYKRGVGKRTGSRAIIANAWDHRTDAFCSLAVLIGLALVRYGGPAYAVADAIGALIVVAMILFSVGIVLQQCTSELLDPQADEAMLDRVRRQAEMVEGVRDVEKLWVRKTGIEYLVDIHIQVDPQMSVDEGHRIGHHVKDSIVRNIDTVRDVMVHLEPFHPTPQATETTN